MSMTTRVRLRVESLSRTVKRGHLGFVVMLAGGGGVKCRTRCDKRLTRLWLPTSVPTSHSSVE